MEYVNKVLVCFRTIIQLTFCLIGIGILRLKQTCDMVLSDLFMTSGRYRLVDMPYSWYQGPARFLIPVPDASLNFASVLKPFSYRTLDPFSSSVLVMFW